MYFCTLSSLPIVRGGASMTERPIPRTGFHEGVSTVSCTPAAFRTDLYTSAHVVADRTEELSLARRSFRSASNFRSIFTSIIVAMALGTSACVQEERGR